MVNSVKTIPKKNIFFISPHIFFLRFPKHLLVHEMVPIKIQLVPQETSPQSAMVMENR